jgi:hypothetical protein
MILVDERLLDNLWRKQDTNWKRPVDYKAKTILNSQLKTSLEDDSVPADIKVKQYQNNLNRFLHTSRKQTEAPTIEPPPLPQKTQKTQKLKEIIVKPKKKIVVKSPRVKRLGKKPLKFTWLEL